MPNFCLERTLALSKYGYVPQIYRFCALSPTSDLHNLCMGKKIPERTNVLVLMDMHTVIFLFST